MSNQTTNRRCRRSPLDDGDLLREVLLRVPPQPSSLPRISLVCKRWRRVLSDPWFLRRNRGHHRTAPLLGFFERRVWLIFHDSKHDHGEKDFVFSPILEPPDRIPPQRFSLARALAVTGQWTNLLGCRHGRVLLIDTSDISLTVIVCDPLIGSHVRLDLPSEFTDQLINGAVICAAGEEGHVHGACHSSPFKVVMVSQSRTDDRRTMACVYSSETGLWGNIIWQWHDRPCRIVEFTNSSSLIGHALYWGVTLGSEEDEDDYMSEPNGILEFDLHRQRLTVLKGHPMNHVFRCRVIKAMDGGVGLATMPPWTLQLQLWHRNVNCHDDATWVLFKTVDLYGICGLQEHERWLCGQEGEMIYWDMMRMMVYFSYV
ncbi:unnamed protein product [Urochloa humidicola]